MSRVGGKRALRDLPPPPPVPRCSPTPPSWLLRSAMDLVERARGSLSRSTLLLRESILEADEEGAGEGRPRRGGEEEEEEGWERTAGRRVAPGEREGGCDLKETGKERMMALDPM